MRCSIGSAAPCGRASFRPLHLDESAAQSIHPMSALAGEFALIERHLRPLAGPGALDLTDDVALLAPPAGKELVLSADAMVEGVHFLPEDPPDLVARKLLR